MYTSDRPSGESATGEKRPFSSCCPAGNVIITPEGTVKVVDFGIAKGATDLSLTGAGLALGTAAYFSPEQAKGERVVPQSDLYSLGVTLYEMLTGRLPFESDTDVGLAFKHVSDAPTPPRPSILNFTRSMAA